MPSVYFSECITVEYDGKRIALDPIRHVDADLTFVSHAHTDHLSTDSCNVLASRETLRIAEVRGYKYRSVVDAEEAYSQGLEMIDSGHVVGSKSLFIDSKILYTGDLCTRDRAFMKGARLPECDILIVESTYGKKGFRFPSIDDVIHRTNKIISELYSKGSSVILMGYPLGKAQVITHLFRHWAPMYIHRSVMSINKICRDLGIEVGDEHALPYNNNNDIRRGPWIMIAPKQSNATEFVRYMKKHYNAVTVSFTGWAMRGRMENDYMLPLSDHCDFYELIDVVNRCKPEKVYTFHGYAEEFAEYLRSIGYDAEPLKSTGNGRSNSNDSYTRLINYI
jgi:putative mRNA 3-end processing factor